MNNIRESLYDLSWKVSEEVYRKDPAYSYSTLSKFNREGFDKLHSLSDRVESPSLLFGSMVDTLLTDGQEEFNNKYLVAEFPNLSDSMLTITKKAFEKHSNNYRTFNDIPDEIISIIGKENDFWANDKWDAVRAKKIKEQNCNEYYNLLFLSENKTVISTKDYQEVLYCVDTLQNSPSTKWYFKKDTPFDNIERFYQLKFKGVYNGIDIRCMLDLVIVDHDNKLIIPCDLKTSYKPEWNFFYSYVDWGYYIQSNLYTYILTQIVQNHPIYKEYTITPYRFIVISKGTKIPLVWEDIKSQCIVDRVYTKFTLKNWRSILADLHYYKQNNPFVPIGIVYEGLNDIETWLQNE